MNETRFKDLPEEEQDWIDAFLNGEINDESFGRLQDRMLERPELRTVMRRCLALHHELQEHGEGATAEAIDSWTAMDAKPEPSNIIPIPEAAGLRRFVPIAIAAGVAFVLGLLFMKTSDHGTGEGEQRAAQAPTADSPGDAEPSAEGFAVVRNLFDARWPEGQRELKEGESLGAESLRLDAGVAEIQFYSGATMVVEGPAEIALKSAWEAACREGSVRMRVPPAARGFRLNAPETEIVDLGTEFGLRVRDGRSHVEVIDGEISFKHRSGPERIVRKGAAWNLPDGADEQAETSGRIAFPDAGNFDALARTRRRTDFERWMAHRDSLARDPKVIAYYTFDRPEPAALLASVAQPRNPELDGAVVLAETTDGRWPGMKQALEFRRPGSRVRVRIPGEFSAFTFAAWVRIDSLDRRYNALFMGDGYENGEPHWQIRDDGKLMLSVMVDHTRSLPGHPQSRFHHVYLSPSIWDLSKSGQWMHLASVFDPETRRVSHHVNGTKISEEEILPQFHVDTLRIGNGEIGNWGEPFRETPLFAIRNLNGRIDELVILDAALSEEEVAQLHEASRAEHR